MTSFGKSVAPATALCMLLGTSAALADVTAEQVWTDWRNYMTGLGYALETTETRSGDRLTVSGTSMTLVLPEEEGTMTVTMGDIGLIDNGDGTVSIDIAPDFPIDVIVDGPDNQDVEVGINYATRGLTTTVSGNPDDLSYTYSAASLALTLESLAIEGKVVDLAEFGAARLEIADIAGSTQMKVGNLRRSAQKFTTGALSYLIDFSEPEGGEGRMVIKGSADALDLRGTVSLPEEMDATDMARMLKAGFALDGKVSIENGATDFNFKDNEQLTQGSSRSTAANLRIVMDDSRLVYAVGAADAAMSISSNELPFPVDFAMAETGFEASVPVMAGEAAQDFELGVTLGDFTMSDMLWGIFDPAGQLPRDPATVAIDLAGKVRLLSDLFDPAQMDALDSGEDAPGEIDALAVNGMTVRAAGAELTGKGAFTFDNSDRETFEGMPAPDGEMNLTLVGGNGLLDKLVAMGLVPEDQASGMRMMMGLFAVPGQGEDTLNSRIEVKGSGQILANGQRIK